MWSSPSQIGIGQGTLGDTGSKADINRTSSAHGEIQELVRIEAGLVISTQQPDKQGGNANEEKEKNHSILHSLA